jgi:endonuclease-3
MIRAVTNARRQMKVILRRLEKNYGPRPYRCWGKAVPCLVETILSQNTSNANSEAGFRILRRTFKTWDEVADVPVAQVARAISISGLSNIKAPRIQSILRQIRDRHGKIDLQFLKDWPPERAFKYLMAFDGVGPKTAYCVLMFSLGMPVFPVDTHIHRIAIRLGLIPPTASAEQAHDLLTPMIAPADRYAMHLLLIAHGREICIARNPRCGVCPLLDLCPTGKAIVSTRSDSGGVQSRREPSLAGTGSDRRAARAGAARRAGRPARTAGRPARTA